MKFHDNLNNGSTGTTACHITEYHSEKFLEVKIKSVDSTPIEQGTGTCMIYSFYRWLYFSYPGYEFHFNGLLNTAFKYEYLEAFYTKVGFTVKDGSFHQIVPKEKFTEFCLNVETRISDISSTFITKQTASYKDAINQSHGKLLELNKHFEEMSAITFIKHRYF
ncbi:GNAT family N-acetyltransferase [Bacillus sp. NPDC094077]|uniref:GNAT family N-acetyltransferase n=1 Tax=Bacillus sp. NPDC094077 TaxID=3390932 RepID=UPI003CFCFC55